MMESAGTTLLRDVEAIQIPSGEAVVLKSGSVVEITQSLGGSCTVHSPNLGGLYRIRVQDADALGISAGRPAVAEGGYEESNVWDKLKECYDPEIPVNIVDLGLVYGLEARDAPGGGKDVHVRMTLTAPGCGMGPSIAADAEQRILSAPGVASARVELAWDPPWSPERISAAGRERLGME